MGNHTLPIDPLINSFATNVCAALRPAHEFRSELHPYGLSILRQESEGFSVGLLAMHERFYLSFGGLEDTVVNVRSALRLFLMALSPLCHLRARVERKSVIWTLAECKDGREYRILAETGYRLRPKIMASDGLWVNNLLSAEECCRLIRMFRCEPM